MNGYYRLTVQLRVTHQKHRSPLVEVVAEVVLLCTLRDMDSSIRIRQLHSKRQEHTFRITHSLMRNYPSQYRRHDDKWLASSVMSISLPASF
jgi:hypothetical protein